MFSAMAYPRPAHALWGVEDISFDPTVWIQDLYTAFFAGEDNLKEYVLDPLAWAAAKAVIHSISQSTVNWINSGFEGSPAFETDLRRSLGQLQDSAANDFFRSLEKNTGIDADATFKQNITNYLVTSYYKSTDGSKSFWETNLDKTTKDPKAFREGKMVGNGGWDGWFSMVMNQKNNTYGAVLSAEDEMNKSFESFRVQRLNELQWGKGFLAWKGSCIEKAHDNSGTSLSTDDNCLKYETKTPGTVIESQLENTLGSNIRQLEIADEIDEIVGALMSQLVSQVLSESGLTGVSKPSAGGGRSYIDRAADPANNSNGSQGTDFLATVDNLKKEIERFKGFWEKIQSMAKEAQTACTTGNNDKQEEITPVLDQAKAALQLAESALTKITTFRAKVVAANESTTNKASALAEVSGEYTKLIQPGGGLPSRKDLADAEIESSEINTSEPTTLYSKMKKLRDDCLKK